MNVKMLMNPKNKQTLTLKTNDTCGTINNATHNGSVVIKAPTGDSSAHEKITVREQIVRLSNIQSSAAGSPSP